MHIYRESENERQRQRERGGGREREREREGPILSFDSSAATDEQVNRTYYARVPNAVYLSCVIQTLLSTFVIQQCGDASTAVKLDFF
jgi:hypothetical protein